jgi:hypothetical protein
MNAISKIIICFLFFQISFASGMKAQQTLKDTSLVGMIRNKTVAIGRIDTTSGKKRFRVVGTGALFYIRFDTNRFIDVVVTAKHVIGSRAKRSFPKSVQVRFSSEDGIPFDQSFGDTVLLTDGLLDLWITHPDSNVDLGCFPVQRAISTIPYGAFAKPQDLFETADVIVPGYPGSLDSNVFNGPINFLTRCIIRQGIVSWVSLNNPINERFLVDCSVFQGNSGSPVFKVPTGLDRSGDFQLGGELKFLGILLQVRFDVGKINYNLIDTVRTSRDTLIISHNVPLINQMNIGVVEPAERVRELLNIANSYYHSITK